MKEHWEIDEKLLWQGLAKQYEPDAIDRFLGTAEQYLGNALLVALGLGAVWGAWKLHHAFGIAVSVIVGYLILLLVVAYASILLEWYQERVWLSGKAPSRQPPDS